MSSRSGREMPEDCVLVSVWMGSTCCCPLCKGRSTSRWQASVLTSPSRLRAQLAPGHIKHLHSCAFWCLATGITKPHLRVSSPHGTGAKSPPEGCLAAGGGRGEGFSIGVFHQDCMFIGWRCPVGQHWASWVPRTLLGGVGRHPRAVRGYRADTHLCEIPNFGLFASGLKYSLSFIWLLMLFFFLWFHSKACISVQHCKGDAFFSLAPSFVKSYPE